MNRPAPDPTHAALLDAIVAHGAGAHGLEDKRILLQQCRTDPALSAMADNLLLERLAGAQNGLNEAKKSLRKLEETLFKFGSPPWFPATFLGRLITPQGPRAYVHHNNARRIVALGDGMTLEQLAVGDDVYLGRELNILLGKAPADIWNCGETCSFERRTADGRFVVRVRDEELVVNAPPALRAVELKQGDQLRWERETMMAREKIERTKSTHHLVEKTPAVSFADIGGLTEQITRVQRALLLDMKHRDVAKQMHRKPKRGILLCGSTGNGKTMIAKALANWMAKEMGAAHSYFIAVPPSGLHSMWYSQSEANYRELFRVARELAAANPNIPVVMFWDEIDYLAARSQHATVQVQNSVLNTFISELDGFADRGNILIIAATNRRDALDPALVRPGRLGDIVLDVPRPNLKAARDIFAKHLVSDLPYARNGHGDDLEATRREIIDTAVARIFAPDGAAELATLVFRDGSRRPVRMGDLINGAMIANIANEAIDRACYRHIDMGVPAELTLEDVDVAITREFDSAVATLTPTNCRAHLTGLPQDLDVVNVQRPQRKVSRPGRFIQVT